MILLNEPWSAIERKLAIERRHESSRRAINFILYAAAWLAQGIGLGAVLTH